MASEFQASSNAFLAKAIANSEAVLKIISLAAIVFYSAGLLVSNSYLSRYGVSDFVLSPQVLITGIWTVIIIALASIPGFVFLLIVTSTDGVLRKILRLFLACTVLVWLVSFVAAFPLGLLIDAPLNCPSPPFSLHGLFMLEWGLPKGWRNLLFELNILLGFTAYVYWQVQSDFPLHTRRKSVWILFPWFLLVFVGACLTVGSGLYPEVKIEMGGGRPKTALVQFDASAEDVLSALNKQTSLKFENPIVSFDNAALNETKRLIQAKLIHAGAETYALGVPICSGRNGSSVMEDMPLIVERRLVSAIYLVQDERCEAKCKTKQ